MPTATPTSIEDSAKEIEAMARYYADLPTGKK